MKKLVIFDLDGTLMNTKPGIVSSLTYSMEKEGLPNYCALHIRQYRRHRYGHNVAGR